MFVFINFFQNLDAVFLLIKYCFVNFHSAHTKLWEAHVDPAHSVVYPVSSAHAHMVDVRWALKKRNSRRHALPSNSRLALRLHKCQTIDVAGMWARHVALGQVEWNRQRGARLQLFFQFRLWVHVVKLQADTVIQRLKHGGKLKGKRPSGARAPVLRAVRENGEPDEVWTVSQLVLLQQRAPETGLEEAQAGVQGGRQAAAAAGWRAQRRTVQHFRRVEHFSE